VAVVRDVVSKFERLVSAGEANVSVSGFNISCPSLIIIIIIIIQVNVYSAVIMT